MTKNNLHAELNEQNFETLYQESISNPQKFWAEQAGRLDWMKFPEKILSGDLSQGNIKFFEDGILNASMNCLDRHLETRANKTALIFEGDDPKDSYKISFKELHSQVCKLSNTLKSRGLKKGDRVCIYLPMCKKLNML